MHLLASHCRQRHTGLIFLLESAPGSSCIHLPPSHCCQRHTWHIFLLESALGVLRHASSGLPLPPAAHLAHLLAGECPRGRHAYIFRPPTAASGTHGRSSCWRAPLGSSGMHLPPSHCRQRHTWHIFLLESAVGVLRHRAHLLAGERPRGPQACVFRPPTAASGTQGSSSCWRAPLGFLGMRLPPSHCRQRHTGLIFLLESALGVLRHASSALTLPPAAHRAHLLAGERPWGS